MTIIKWIVYGLVALAVLALLVGQLGMLRGQAPSDLGVKGGKLKRPSRTPNSVSSQARDWPGDMAQAAYIDPITWQAPMTGRERLKQLRAVLEAMPNLRIVEARDDYLYAQATTKLMKYVDDLEFWLHEPAGVIHVRSASRIGRKDFDANRTRIEAIRSRLP